MKIELEYKNVSFSITVNENSYDVIRLGKNETVGSKGYGNITEKSLGYFSSFSKSVDSIIKSTFSTMDESVSLREFVDRFNEGRKELLELVD